MSEANESLLGIAFNGLLRAPLRGKLALLANVVLLLSVFALTLAEADNVNGSGARVVGLALMMAGALVLSVAYVLFSMSQQQQCSFFALKREALALRGLRPRRLDEVLVAFPVLAFVAGCMMAAGMGMSAAGMDRWRARLALGFVAAWFFVWTVSMIASTTRFLFAHAREQAEAAARARSEATESQLAALQAQMNPHFLFNALNTVASLIRTDAKAAEATVENLAVVLRRTLDRSRRVLSTVDDEVDHLAAYLSVAKQRFEDRLQVDWAIDPRARSTLLPTMTLQPLVENSLKHGIGARLEGGALHIGVQLEDLHEDGDSRTVLAIVVADDGPGFPRGYHEGTGLANLRARLRTLYGDAARLAIDSSAPGARVVVTVPAVSSSEELLPAGASSAAIPVAAE